MKVMKFGGSSVANAENMEKVASLVINESKKRELKAVVVSALAGVTDDLVSLSKLTVNSLDDAKLQLKIIENRHLDLINLLFTPKYRASILARIKTEFNKLDELITVVGTLKECSLRTKDKILSFGEIVSSYIFFELLKSKNISVEYVNSTEVIKTSSDFGNAEVNFQKTKELISNATSNESIYVFGGFIGSDDNGDITTLGRGGSDFTASIIAVCIDASEVEIWTDVDGVLTCDPRIVPTAIPIPKLTYEEAMELSHFGAKVIYPPTIQPVYKKQIPIRIRNTFNPDFIGTLINSDKCEHAHKITGISSVANVSLVRLQGTGMQGITGTAGRVFTALSAVKINVILITQASSEHSICFAVDPNHAKASIDALSVEFENELNKRKLDPIVVQNNCSIISIVGENMRNLPGISATFFQALGKNGVNVIAIAQGSSELNISAVIDTLDRNKALNAVHDAFFLSGTRKLNLFLAGDGLIGSTLLNQIQEHRFKLIQNYQIAIELCGVTNSRKMLIADSLEWKEISKNLSEKGDSASLEEFTRKIIDLRLPNSVFVDCSASEEVPKFYTDLLNSNIAVITPNKKGLSGSFELFNIIKKSQEKHGTDFLYETCVGAGLPVISTLKDLIKSGDEILEIQAVLSGTLSFIFNNFVGNKNFVDVLSEAMSFGYTEPDPRDDLTGLDVGRKLLILAREIGVNLSIEDIQIENLVPIECRSCSKENFLDELNKFQKTLNDRKDKAVSNNSKLCYIGKVDQNGAIASLVEVGTAHPFYSLSGSDNIIMFKTRRYNTRPLVIRGPGAGADVTAAGVFADILRVVS
jgi:aspartokinase/homoserine dehydrogenase 1